MSHVFATIKFDILIIVNLYHMHFVFFSSYKLHAILSETYMERLERWKQEKQKKKELQTRCADFIFSSNISPSN